MYSSRLVYDLPYNCLYFTVFYSQLVDQFLPNVFTSIVGCFCQTWHVAAGGNGCEGTARRKSGPGVWHAALLQLLQPQLYRSPSQADHGEYTAPVFLSCVNEIVVYININYFQNGFLFLFHSFSNCPTIRIHCVVFTQTYYICPTIRMHCASFPPTFLLSCRTAVCHLLMTCLKIVNCLFLCE